MKSINLLNITECNINYHPTIIGDSNWHYRLATHGYVHSFSFSGKSVDRFAPIVGEH